MKSLISIICLIGAFSLNPFRVFSQPGKDGFLVVNTPNTIVNCYTAVVVNANSGSTTISTDNACAFECGDLIMIYQAQGATVNTTNTPLYGQVTALNSAGLYEFNYVLSNAGGVLTLQNPLTNTYSAQGKTQVIKVPQYTTLTVAPAGSIVAAPWQVAGAFKRGGLVVIHATGTVTVNGKIDASFAGFKAGAIDQNTSPGGNPQIVDFVGNDDSRSAEKGESIAGDATNYDAFGGRYGKGAIANGGGGGNAHNCGGGGGSNGNNNAVYNGQGIMCTACLGSAAWNLDPFVIATGFLANSSGGGRGGYSFAAANLNALLIGPDDNNWNGNRRNSNGGFGGYPLTNLSNSRVFLGGGGGAGDANNNANLRGGNGGGIVFIVAPIVTGVGFLEANGENALNQIALGTGGANDAPCGGGGGGGIVIKGTAGVQLLARGGKGGDQGALANESEGPGGGGSGGFIAFTAGAPILNVTGGANGITLSGSLTEFIPNGATSGASGNTTNVPAAFITFIPVNLTALVNTPVCQGTALNFSSTVNYAGGTYQWTGPAGFTSTAANPTRTGTVPAHSGNYQLIYTSIGGCKDTVIVPAIVNPLPVVSITPSAALCATGCSGTATANIVTPSLAPYSFLWNSGAVTQSISNICPGAINVTITDANLCTANSNSVITAPIAINLTSVVTNVSCFGLCNGSVTLAVTGGTGAITFKKNSGPSQASPVFGALCFGSYTFTATDANGCLQNLVVNVTQPNLLTASIVSIVNATCGINNGAVTIGATGGTTTYTYVLGATSNTTGIFLNLSPGAYTVFVTDAQNCTTSVPLTIIALPVPNLLIQSQQNIACAGGNNGSVILAASGGIAPYQYAIGAGPFGASNLFAGLMVGTYTFQVRDVNNCLATVNATITSPTPVAFTAVPTAVLCNGQCNGQIAVTVSGGVTPYSYSSNSGTTFQASSILTGLCAGSYDVVVRDFNGCLINGFFNITQPAIITLNALSSSPLCNGQQNGTITANALGGVGGFSYNLNNGVNQASNLFTGIAAGNVLVTVTDGNGCTAQATAILVDPAPILIAQIAMTPSNCGFNNGAFEVQATGSFPAFNYSDNGSPFQASGIFSNVFSGIHVIVVQDAQGCLDTLFAGVNDLEMSGQEISRAEPLCFGGNDGNILVQNIAGAAPINYELDGNGLVQSSGFFSGLSAGSHIVVIFDAGNCIFTIPFFLNEPPPVVFTTIITDVTCNGGSDGAINFASVSGGTPGAYTYSIDNGLSFVPTNVFSSLSVGTFDLVVQDVNNCLANGIAIIDETLPIVISSNISNLTCNNDNSGFVSLNATGGNGIFSYNLNASTNSTGFFTGLAADNYIALVNDQFGCTANMNILVTEPPLLDITGTSTAPLCANTCNGTIFVNATGGTGAYNFTQDFISYNATGLFTNECAGPKMVYVNDQNQCQDSVPLTIIDPNPIALTSVLSPSTCSQANGSITLNASGGVGAFQYSIDNGANFAPLGSFTLLLAGPYTVVAQDANACETDSFVQIIDLPAPVVSGVTSTNVSCFGQCNGSIQLSSSGGTGVVSYSLNGVVQPSGNYSGLCAGNYTMVVTDINGCQVSQIIVITEPALLTLAPIPTNLSCFQNNTGAISIAAAGGTSPYFYSFNNGASFGAVNSTSFLAAGNYSLVLKDQQNCTVNVTQLLTQPALLSAQITSTQPSCLGLCDGAAIAVVSGGTPGGFAYIWNGTNSVLASAGGFCSGNYNFEMSDINGCAFDTTFTIIDPILFVLDSVTAINTSCNSVCDGEVTIFASTAVTYSFNSAPMQPANTQVGFCAGVYPVSATNAQGCIADGLVLVEEPDPLLLFSSPDSLMCINDTIPLFGFALGGTAPYTFTWSNGFIGANQNVIQTIPEVFTVNVVDNNGCTTAAETTTLSILPSLAFTTNPAVSFCPNDPVVLSVLVTAGAPNYSYQWSTNINDTLTSVTVNPLVNSSTYTVTVSDVCVSIDTLITVTQFLIPTPVFEIDNQNGCTPLTVEFGTDFSDSLTNCSWTFSDGQSFNSCGPITATFVNIGCWNAQLVAQTLDGCPVNFDFIDAVCVNDLPVANFFYNPNQPTEIENTLQFFNTSTANATVFDWQIGVSYTSSLENPTYQFDNITAQSTVGVCLIVSSDDGCLDTICKQITFGSDFLFWVPNSFTPDGDNYNGYFGPVFSTNDIVDNYQFEIYDRWGERIFESADQTQRWDATYRGNIVQDGTYVWVLYFKNKQKGKVERIEGHINVLK